MKAFVLESPGKALIKEIEEPQIIDAYQAKLSPIAISMCTSDVNTVYGTGSKKPDNLVLGHEAIARVVEVGEKVRDFKMPEMILLDKMGRETESVESANPNSFVKIKTDVPMNELDMLRIVL